MGSTSLGHGEHRVSNHFMRWLIARLGRKDVLVDEGGHGRFSLVN